MKPNVGLCVYSSVNKTFGSRPTCSHSTKLYEPFNYYIIIALNDEPSHKPQSNWTSLSF